MPEVLCVQHIAIASPCRNLLSLWHCCAGVATSFTLRTSYRSACNIVTDALDVLECQHEVHMDADGCSCCTHSLQQLPIC
jgi:hypothetical protein